MGKNLLLTNLIDSYSFEKTKKFMTKEIKALFQKYETNTVKEVDEVLLLTNAVEGIDKDVYLRKVEELFGDVVVKQIPLGGDTVDLINRAKAIAIGGGDMDLLKNSIRLAMRTAIINKINDGIPYIGWNEGAIFACPSEISFSDAQADTFLAAVPFQVVCHYIDSDANRDTIGAFIANNDDIDYVVCFSDEEALAAPLHTTSEVPRTMAAGDDNKLAATDDGGSGVRIEDEDEELVAESEAPAPILFKLLNGKAVEAPGEFDAITG